MGNIITFTSQEVFGLDHKVLANKKERKKIFVPATSIIRGRGLYSFIRKS